MSLLSDNSKTDSLKNGTRLTASRRGTVFSQKYWKEEISSGEPANCDNDNGSGDRDDGKVDSLGVGTVVEIVVVAGFFISSSLGFH